MLLELESIFDVIPCIHDNGLIASAPRTFLWPALGIIPKFATVGTVNLYIKGRHEADSSTATACPDSQILVLGYRNRDLVRNARLYRRMGIADHCPDWNDNQQFGEHKSSRLGAADALYGVSHGDCSPVHAGHGRLGAGWGLNVAGPAHCIYHLGCSHEKWHTVVDQARPDSYLMATSIKQPARLVRR
jgi:hypothetical protein